MANRVFEELKGTVNHCSNWEHITPSLLDFATVFWKKLWEGQGVSKQIWYTFYQYLNGTYLCLIFNFFPFSFLVFNSNCLGILIHWFPLNGNENRCPQVKIHPKLTFHHHLLRIAPAAVWIQSLWRFWTTLTTLEDPTLDRHTKQPNMIIIL